LFNQEYYRRRQKEGSIPPEYLTYAKNEDCEYSLPGLEFQKGGPANLFSYSVDIL
jgi:hypothetical protein